MKKWIFLIAVFVAIMGGYLFYQFSHEQRVIAQFNELTRLSNSADKWSAAFDKQYDLDSDAKNKLEAYVEGQIVILGDIRALLVDKELKNIRDNVVAGLRADILENSLLAQNGSVSESRLTALTLKINESYATGNKLARDFMWQHNLNTKARLYGTWATWTK